MSLVLLSLKSAVAVACGMVMVKSVAFRFASWFRLSWLGVPVVLAVLAVVKPVVGVVPVVLVVVRLFCKATVALVGGLIPRVFDLSRLICSTATSTMTSALALYRSPINFCASAIWSGVPRTTIALCEGKG